VGARIRGLMVLVVVLLTGAVLGTAGAQWLTAEPDGAGARSSPIQTGATSERIRVEVLNGGGQSGLARETTGYLRDRGFDVVEVGNWKTFDEDSTFVLARTGDVEVAYRVAGALGVSRVAERPDPNLFVDVSVVLGRDWSLERLSAGDQPETEVPWWDLRQYLKRPGAPSPGARLADPDPGEGSS